MKQSIPMPVVAGVIAVIVAIVAWFAYSNFIAQPGTSGPYKQRSENVGAPPAPPNF